MIEPSKLTPLPLKVVKTDVANVVDAKGWIVAEFAFAVDAEFHVTARQAFDVMMRRTWYAEPNGFDGQHDAWIVCSRIIKRGAPNVIARYCFAHDLPLPKPFAWPDPFTALIEADRWLTAKESEEVGT